MTSQLRLYSVAILLALWSATRLAGVNSDILAGACLGIAAALVIVAEKERQRLVRRHRDGYEPREDDS